MTLLSFTADDSKSDVFPTVMAVSYVFKNQNERTKQKPVLRDELSGDS